jgi:hypothetical protein
MYFCCLYSEENIIAIYRELQGYRHGQAVLGYASRVRVFASCKTVCCLHSPLPVTDCECGVLQVYVPCGDHSELWRSLL